MNSKLFSIHFKIQKILLFLFLGLGFFGFSQDQSMVSKANNCQGKTFTQGGWGASNMTPWQVNYLYNNFDQAFPGGLTIGCNSGFTLKLTSAQAVTDFLPSGGTPSALTQNWLNPDSSYSNTLAGQLVSVTLAVVFDANDVNFSSSNTPLGDFFIMSGTFQGKTVNQFLQLANDFIGGCGSSSFSATDFNIAATAINENYDGGNVDNGFLSCCNLKAYATFDPIKCNGDKTIVHVTATGGSSSTTGTGDFEVGAGTYTYVVKDGNCEDSVTVTITEPSKLMMEVSATPILCNGGQSTVTVSASGGTEPYTGTGTFTVSAGTYTYVVKDANGCEVSKEITITEPTKLVASCTSVNAKCNGEKGSITVTATGGTAPYTGTGTFDVLAGTYSYTVTDANGCSSTTSCTVTEPTKLEIQVSSTPILCNGGQSTVTVTATGGTEPYSGTGTWDVSAGTYTYTVTDANGCSATQSITITQPTPLNLSISKNDVACYNGTATVTANVSGGTPPYSYLWSNGATSATVSLTAGSYSVTVTDANGCKISGNVEVKQLTCNGFTTVTQGGWGAKAAGNNWGTYRDKNFAAAFPTGLTVGAGTRFLKLTTAKAVDDFLPSGTTARALNPGTMTNPGATYQNVLAGQVVALTLSVRFDEWDANFSPNATKLGDLIVNSGIFAGMTVYQILAEANKVLGGVSSMYSVSDMNSIVDAINNNYDGGKVNLGLLSCPCNTLKPVIAAKNNPIAKPAPEVITRDEVTLYPNPSSGEINVRFDVKKDSKVLVQIYNAQGTLVGDYSNNVVRTGEKGSLYINNPNLASGLYLVRVKTSTTEKTIKLIIRK